MKEILLKILDNPLECGFLIIGTIVALGVFFLLAGNPFAYLANLLQKLIPFAIKELRLKARAPGIINLFICMFTALLAILFIVKPSLTAFVGQSDISNEACGVIVFIVTACVFITSLRVVRDFERTIRLYGRRKR